MTQNEVIAALDRATKPSWGLDNAIWAVVVGWSYPLIGAAIHDFAENGGAFTSSLDAALTLVPEGWEWLRKSERTMTVYRVPDDDKTWATHIDGAHSIPAIALCIAALKARSPTDGR